MFNQLFASIFGRHPRSITAGPRARYRRNWLNTTKYDKSYLSAHGPLAVLHPSNRVCWQANDGLVSHWEAGDISLNIGFILVSTESIIRLIHESGGRFLKQATGANAAGWEEVDDLTIRKKVAHSFRARRNVLNKRQWAVVLDRLRPTSSLQNHRFVMNEDKIDQCWYKRVPASSRIFLNLSATRYHDDGKRATGIYASLRIWISHRFASTEIGWQGWTSMLQNDVGLTAHEDGNILPWAPPFFDEFIIEP